MRPSRTAQHGLLLLKAHQGRAGPCLQRTCRAHLSVADSCDPASVTHESDRHPCWARLHFLNQKTMGTTAAPPRSAQSQPAPRGGRWTLHRGCVVGTEQFLSSQVSLRCSTDAAVVQTQSEAGPEGWRPEFTSTSSNAPS